MHKVRAIGGKDGRRYRAASIIIKHGYVPGYDFTSVSLDDCLIEGGWLSILPPVTIWRRCIFRRRVGILLMPKTEEWLLNVYGIEHFQAMKDIALDLAQEFKRNVAIALVDVSEGKPEPSYDTGDI